MESIASPAVGRLAIWCSLYIVIAEFAVVAMRYLFGLGSIRLQESVLYCRRLGSSDRRSCPRRYLLRAGGAPHPGARRPFRRGFLSFAFRNRADAGGAPLCAAFLVYL